MNIKILEKKTILNSIYATIDEVVIAINMTNIIETSNMDIKVKLIGILLIAMSKLTLKSNKDIIFANKIGGRLGVMTQI